MKISTKARYGLKAIYILGTSSSEIVSLNELSKEIGVGAAYIEQLMRLLKKDGIVTSVRGVSGGYHLAKAAENITLGEILRSLEDNLELIECVSTGACKSNCKTFKVWKIMSDAINASLDSITLQNMINDNEEYKERI